MDNDATEKIGESENIPVIESIPEFLVFYDRTEEIHEERNDDVYKKYFRLLEDQTNQCDALLNEVSKLKSFS